MSSLQIVLKTVATTIDLLVAIIGIYTLKGNPRIGLAFIFLINLCGIWC